jgi:hypothetical protein
VRVAGGVERLLVGEHERERPADARQQSHRGLFDAGVGGRGGEQLGHEVRVGARLDGYAVAACGANAGDLVAQLGGVDQVAVVPEGDATSRGGGAKRRLRVLPRGGAGGGVAAVPDGKVALQRLQGLLVEDLADEAEVLEHDHPASVGHGHPGRLLAAVLQGVEPVVGEVGDILARSPDAEDAALLPRTLIRSWAKGELLDAFGRVLVPAGTRAHKTLLTRRRLSR